MDRYQKLLGISFKEKETAKKEKKRETDSKCYRLTSEIRPDETVRGPPIAVRLAVGQ